MNPPPIMSIHSMNFMLTRRSIMKIQLVQKQVGQYSYFIAWRKKMSEGLYGSLSACEMKSQTFDARTNGCLQEFLSLI